MLRSRVKAGSHLVGVTFLAENYRPSLDLIRQYERKSLEDNPIPQLQYHPAVGSLRIRGPFTATRPEDSRSLRKVYTCQPASAEQELPCAKQILTTLMRRAYRRPVTAQDLEWVLGFYQEGRREGTFQDGIELALRRILTSPQFLVRAEREPENISRASRIALRISNWLRGCRSCSGAASRMTNLIDVAAKNQLHQPAVLEREVRRMLADPKADALVENFRRPVALPAEPARHGSRWSLLSELGRRAAQEFPPRNRAAVSEHHQGKPQRARPAEGGLHVPE